MSDNEKETQVAEETQNTQAAAESNNEDRKSRRGQRGEGRRGERRNRREESHENEMLDRVVTINRVSKTHKGGRTFSFAALVVVGDGKGTVGVGYGKSREVPAAIAKGQLDAKKHMFTVPRIKGTVTHPVIGHDAAGTVLLRPAAFQLPLPVHMQFGQFPFQVFPVRSQINQGGQIHISADARAAIIDQGSHDDPV